MAGACEWGALRTRPLQPELPTPPVSPGGNAFEDHGPKVVQQKACSALVQIITWLQTKLRAGALGFRLHTTTLVLPAAKTKPSLKMPQTVGTPTHRRCWEITDKPRRKHSEDPFSSPKPVNQKPAPQLSTTLPGTSSARPWHGEEDGRGEPGGAWEGRGDGGDKDRLPGDKGLEGEGPQALGWERGEQTPVLPPCASQPDTRDRPLRPGKAGTVPSKANHGDDHGLGGGRLQALARGGS